MVLQMSRKSNNSGCVTIIGIFLIIGFVSAYWPVILGIVLLLIILCVIYRLSKNNGKKDNNSFVYIEKSDNFGNSANTIEINNTNGIHKENNHTISIDTMNGYEFEYLCSKILIKQGYENVEVTKGSGDQGVDIIAYRDGVKYAVQCKRYSQAVGNKAVQEIYAGKQFYGCHVGIIMTNNYFTSSAKELAQRNGIILWDRDMMNKFDYFSILCGENEYQDSIRTNEKENFMAHEEVENENHHDTGLNEQIDASNNSNYDFVVSKTYEAEMETMTDSVVDEKSFNTKDKLSMYDKENGIYPAGTYLVGEDIAIGKYLLVSRGNSVAGLSIYETYAKYKKDELLSYNSFQGDYYLALRENGLFIEVDNADIRRI